MGNSFLLICLPPQTCESWDSIFPRDHWRGNWPAWKSKKHQETQSLLMHASSSLQAVKRSRKGTRMDWNFSHLHWFLTCTMWQCAFVWKKCAPLNSPVNFNLIIMFTIESYTGHIYIYTCFLWYFPHFLRQSQGRFFAATQGAQHLWLFGFDWSCGGARDVHLLVYGQTAAAHRCARNVWWHLQCTKFAMEMLGRNWCFFLEVEVMLLYHDFL